MIQTEVDNDVTNQNRYTVQYTWIYLKSNLEHSTNHEPYILNIRYLKVRVNLQLSSDRDH